MSAGNAAQQSWPAVSATVPAGRRFVRRFLAGHDLTVLADDAELLVTELVGNVVLHVGGTVTVAVRREGSDVLVEVSDRSPVTPMVRAFSASSSTGRGMRLVHSLAAEHGIRLDDAGKTIWVRLTTQTAGRSDDDVAEAFADVDWLAELTDLTDVGASGSDGQPVAFTVLPLAA